MGPGGFSDSVCFGGHVCLCCQYVCRKGFFSGEVSVVRCCSISLNCVLQSSSCWKLRAHPPTPHPATIYHASHTPCSLCRAGFTVSFTSMVCEIGMLIIYASTFLSILVLFLERQALGCRNPQQKDFSCSLSQIVLSAESGRVICSRPFLRQ